MHTQRTRRRIAQEQRLTHDDELEARSTMSRLQAGNDQLTAGLSAEALRAIYGPTGPDLGELAAHASDTTKGSQATRADSLKESQLAAGRGLLLGVGRHRHPNRNSKPHSSIAARTA